MRFSVLGVVVVCCVLMVDVGEAEVEGVAEAVIPSSPSSNSSSKEEEKSAVAATGGGVCVSGALSESELASESEAESAAATVGWTATSSVSKVELESELSSDPNIWALLLLMVAGGTEGQTNVWSCR